MFLDRAKYYLLFPAKQAELRYLFGQDPDAAPADAEEEFVCPNGDKQINAERLATLVSSGKVGSDIVRQLLLDLESFSRSEAYAEGSYDCGCFD